MLHIPGSSSGPSAADRRGSPSRLSRARERLQRAALVAAVAVLTGWGHGALAQTPEPRRVFDNGNVGAVQNGPTRATTFRLPTRTHLTEITTYHWNSGRGAAGGTLQIVGISGDVYGPWSARVVDRFYWTAQVNLTLPAGEYRIVDSAPATWAQNAQSGGAGMAWILGFPDGEGPREAVNGNAERLVSRRLTPSSEPQAVAFENRVRVVVPGGLLTEPRDLTIATPSRTHAPPAAFSAMAVYEISLGSSHTFAQPLTIEMAIDRSKLDPQARAGDQMAFARYDPDTGTWVSLRASVDEATLVATFEVDHLSEIGEFYLQRQYKVLKDAQGLNPFGHFRVIYDDRLSAPAIAVPATAPLFGGRKVYTMKMYAELAGSAAEHAFEAYWAYRDEGLNVPRIDPPGTDPRIDLIVGDWRALFPDVDTLTKPEDDSQYSWTTGAIFLRQNHEWAELMLTVAHELFHLIQHRDLTSGQMSAERWFVEATAEYAAGRLAWGRRTLAGQRMGSPMTPIFLQACLRYVGETGNTDPQFNHHQKTSHFLDFLIKGTLKGRPVGGSETERFLALWKLFVARRDAFRALDEWLGPGEPLNWQYERFAAFYLFNTNSPLPANPRDRLPMAVAAGNWILLKASETQATGERVSIPAAYASGIWAIRVEPKDGEPTRAVSVRTVARVPSDTMVSVYRLSGASRIDLGLTDGRWDGPQPVCGLTGTKDCLLDLPPEDSDVAVTVVDMTPPATALPNVSANTPAPGGSGRWVFVDRRQTGGQVLNDFCNDASVSLKEGTMRVVVSGGDDICKNHRYAFSASWSPSAFPSALTPGQAYQVTLTATMSASGVPRDEGWNWAGGLEFDAADGAGSHFGGARIHACWPGDDPLCHASDTTTVTFQPSAGRPGGTLVLKFEAGAEHGVGGYEYRYRWEP